MHNQHSTLDINHSVQEMYIVYIINCVWAAVLQECRGSFGKNRLHPGIQSAIDGERLGLRPLKTNFMFLDDWRFISINFDIDPCIHGRDPLNQKTADGRTDGLGHFRSFFGGAHQFWPSIAKAKVTLQC